MTVRTLVLVRHAEAQPPSVGGPSEYRRPLTRRGRAQADALADTLANALAPATVTAVLSSPYARATATVTPLAERLGLAVEPVDDLREWHSALAPTPDWAAHYRRCWDEPGWSLPGGETHHHLERRAVRAADLLAARPGTVVAATHGTLLSRLLHGLGAPVDADFWLTMPMPAVYTVHHAGPGRWRQVTGPGLTAAFP